MAHAIIAVYGSPEKQKKFIEMVNSMEYDFQGDLKGKTKPFLSEVKLYDIRIKKEVVPAFLRDVGAQLTQPIPHSKDGGDLKHMNRRDAPFRLVQFFLRIFHWLTPFKGASVAPGTPDPKYQLEGWNYVFFLGSLDDPHTPEGGEIL